MCGSAQTPRKRRERLSLRWGRPEKESKPMTGNAESFVVAEAARFTWERRAPVPEDHHVLAHTWNWLNALPKGVRPVHLPDQFPRITNDLSRLWPETAALEDYFAEKEFSPRPDRKGFPPLIKEELLAMHLYSLRNRRAPSEERPPARRSLLA